ncbi:MAG: DUF1887 family protein [Firmicutes bacterium]|nr:DUF1887 family protein [Bacillota bacterium]
MSLERFKTECLFLLVGTNPLPNYVASLLLAMEGGKVILLHSRGTGKIAENIKLAVENRKIPVEIQLWEIDETDGERIARKLEKDVFPSLNAPTSIGLNYTGGTKSMAVHSYRALERFVYEREIPAVFSYLDARTLSMFFNTSESPSTKRVPVREKLKIMIEELLALHGYRVVSIKREPLFPVQAIRLTTIFHQGIRSREQLEGEFLAAFDKGYKSIEEVACGEGEDKVTINNWLEKNHWLEHYVLWAIKEIEGRVGIHDCACEIKPASISTTVIKRNPREEDFEADVVAMRGYQLYLISCTTHSKKKDCKMKLFEAYIRASQMGGDEAKAGLVCCSDDPLLVQQEIEEDWLTEGRVRVFGREDLPNLKEKLRDWFEST